MKKIISILSVGVFFLITGCATMVDDKVVASVEGPNVSPTVIAAQNASPDDPTGLKRKVAIARFTNETRTGQSFFLDKDNDRIGKAAVDILSKKLMDTDKFILLERADLDKIQKELKMADLEPYKNAADYLIVGSITEYGYKTTSDTGVFSRVRTQTAYAKVYIRLIDIHTGQIIYSTNGAGEASSQAQTTMGVGSTAGYDETLGDKAIDAAITQTASNIIETLLDRPWKSYLLAYQNGLYMISGGKSQNIQPGRVFDVYKKGDRVKNPQTGLLITLPATKVGTLEVISTAGDTPENEVSFAKPTSGNVHAYGPHYTNIFVTTVKGDQ